ncbi:MAG: BrnT family toxin [Bryobacterales bacterium]|nr:BrnT family toxin [Bryobacterales bacterium]
MEFVWDARNIEHLKRHKITPQEAEETILLDCLESDLQQHAGEERVLCFGRTAQGRLLTIIYTMRGEAVRVVTGYPMTRSQQRLYFRRK